MGVKSETFPQQLVLIAFLFLSGRLRGAGYYFYESQNQKIPIEGSSNGSGAISFVAQTNEGDENFDGQFTGSMLEDFSGTWSKGSKQLNFSLNSKK